MSTGNDTQTVKSGLGKKFDKYAGNLVDKAGNLIDKGRGFNPYPDQPYTDLAPATQQALQQMQQLAGQGNAFYQPAANFTQGLIGGDYAHDTSGFSALYGQNPNAVAQNAAGIASGANGINVNGQLQGIINGGMPNAIAQNAGGIASGAQGITAGNQLQTLLGQGPANAAQQYAGGIAAGTDTANAVDQYGRRIASGNKGITTEGDYRSLLGGVDSEFENVLQNTLGDVRDEIQGQFGGASYGSAANTDYLTKGLSDVSSKMRSDNFYKNLAAKQGILGDITGVQGQNLNTQLSAMGQLSGEQAGNLGRQLSAAGLISGEQQGGINSQSNIIGQLGNFQNQNIGNQLAASGMLSGEQLAGINAQSGILGQIGGFQGQNIDNQLAASGMLSGEQQQAFNNNRGILGDVASLNQQNIQNQAQGVGMAPGVYGQQYLPSQIMAGVGQTQQAQADKELAALMEQFGIKDMQGWNRLQAGANLLTGAVPGATQTKTAITPTNPFGQIAGLGLAGAQLAMGMPPTAALSGTGGMY